jgi:putative endonuclease
MVTSPVPVPSAADRRRTLGQRGEEAAARWYLAAGYRIVDRNWRGGADGEIDIVALDPGGTTVVVCEVKTRSSVAFGRPEEAVTQVKQRRLRRLAARWLSEDRTPGAQSPSGSPPGTQSGSASGRRAVRFDVAAVMDSGASGLVVDVVQDAF